MSGNINYTHSFSKAGSLSVIANASYLINRTIYSGTSSTDDETRSTKYEPLIRYSYNMDKFYGQITSGWDFTHSASGKYKDNSNSPAFAIALQYSPNSKHSLQANFGYSLSDGVSGYNSTVIIHVNPLLSYTGNPNIKPRKLYMGTLNYTWLPSNKFNFSVFGNIMGVGNRAAYLYEANSTGVLRSIIQPAGGYTQGSYGAYGILRLVNDKLQLTAQLSQTIGHNGYPYSWTKSHIQYSLQATYYEGNWNFGGYFVSSSGYPDGYMVGTWMKTVNNAAIWAGWANSTWNFKCLISNPYRWNWNESTLSMNSKYYDSIEKAFNSNSHCFVQLSATYTFGFGKKIRVGNEAQQQTGVSSGILK